MKMKLTLACVSVMMGQLACASTPGPDVPNEGLTADEIRSGAQIVLKYDATRKADLIKYKLFKAADFTGNNIVVKSTKTSLDIDWLVAEHEDTAPNSMCAKGSFSGVKKLVLAMLSNTDGNGDHYLDDGYKITALPGGKGVNVVYSVTGEGGPRPYELEFPQCK